LEVLGDNTRKVEENARLTHEVVGLRDRVATLEREKEQRAQMVFDKNVYWREGGTNRDGPYCPKCLDGNDKASRLADRSDDHWWRCPVCGLSIEKPGPAPFRGNVQSDYDPFN
jgi:hypothetical protein